jgi:probable HAF family extracellular repeat protein
MRRSRVLVIECGALWERSISHARSPLPLGRASAGSFHISADILYSLTDLGTNSIGNGINNAGQVVGYAYTSGGEEHAFLYSNGQMYDLNDLIDPALALTLSEANAINDQSQIVANHRTDFGESSAYLLTPITTPSRNRARWRCAG